MKMEFLKNGTTVLNKLNGRKYIVTETLLDNDSEAGIAGIAETFDVISGTVYEEATPEYDTVLITESNAICFRALSIPKDLTVPTGFTVSDGVLYQNGVRATEQGEIVVRSIIAQLPGYLVLGVQPRDESEDEIDLFSYTPSRDEFKKLIRTAIPATVKAVKYFADSAVLGYSQTHSEPVKDEDGNNTGETVEKFDSCSLMVVKNQRVTGERFDRPMELELLPVLGTTDVFLLKSEKRVDESGTIVDGEPYYEAVTISNGEIASEELWSSGKPIISASRVLSGGLLLQGKDFLVSTATWLRVDSPLLEKLPPVYLVDDTERGDRRVITLADEYYNTYTVTRRSTRDRGYIVTLS